MRARSLWLKLFFLCLSLLAAVFAWSCGDDESGGATIDDAGVPPTNAACTVTPPVDCKELAPGDRLPEVLSECRYVKQASTYEVEYLNIVQGGALVFLEPESGKKIDFKAKSILVEAGGRIEAGSEACPFGSNGGRLSIGLYGDDPSNAGLNADVAPGIRCKTGGGTCIPDGGAPKYCTGGDPNDPLYPCNGPAPAAAAKNAEFLAYHHLNFDKDEFGHKTLSVAYGGTIRFFGYKGAAGAPKVESPVDDAGAPHCRVPTEAEDLQLDSREMQSWANLTGSSWARLVDQRDVGEGDAASTEITLDRKLDDWDVGDEIVVGPTDWYPGHYENRTVSAKRFDGERTTLTVPRLRYPHATKIFDVEKEFGSHDAGAFTQPVNRKAVDTRAPVGLLSRSIQIRSLGSAPDKDFMPAKECLSHDSSRNPHKVSPNCYFGGHVMVRQGFREAKLQGVELKQLGQGGRMGHYPIHFHMTKAAPYTKAFFKDGSVWDSMTRFVTLHGAHGVEVSRNVGYLSVGHGYYLEDASEIDNLLCHNLGIGARAPLWEYYDAQKAAYRAAVEGLPAGGRPDAPPTARFVPPILDGSHPNSNTNDTQQFGSDGRMPIMYWVMNGHNEVVGNMASGVHGWGSCYWLIGSALSGMSRESETFEGLAVFNGGSDFKRPNEGAVGYQVPLYRFRGNSCSTASQALVSVKDAPPVGKELRMQPVSNPYLVSKEGGPKAVQKHDYVRPIVLGSFNPINPETPKDERNCSAAQQSGAAKIDSLEVNDKACAMTLVDRFTTSFNWSEVNFSSVWLRPTFYAFTNGAVTDQIGAGVTIVTAGDWMQVQPGYYSLIKNSLFVGTSQPNGSVYAKRSGPIVKVKANASTNNALPQCQGITCNFDDQGTGYFSTGFNPKRLLNIYDGPAFADGNTFVNVGAWKCDVASCRDKDLQACDLPCASDEADKDRATCNREMPCGVYQPTIQPSPDSKLDLNGTVVVDAAIGWKQENGFYYAPAFAHRRNSFLAKVPSSAPVENTTPMNRCLAKKPLPDGGYFEGFLEGDCRHNVVDRRRNYVVGSQLGIRGKPLSFPSDYPRVVLKDGGVPDEQATQAEEGLPVTPIDFQTILLDVDGTLTGATGSLVDGGVVQPSTSVSGNPFFDAPSQTEECLSFGVQTSAFQYVSTMMARLEGTPAQGNPAYVAYSPANAPPQESLVPNGWYQPMVGIYRQFLFAGEKGGSCGNVCNGKKYDCPRASFMMGPGVFHTSHLTASVPPNVDLWWVNPATNQKSIKSLYYIDTGSGTPSGSSVLQPTDCVVKRLPEMQPARFNENETYAIYNLFPRNDTKVSYSFYVGKNVTLDELKPRFVRVHPHEFKPTAGAPYKQSKVTFDCDPSTTNAANVWCRKDTYVTLENGILTVLLDHGKAGDSDPVGKFRASAAEPYERCMTHDLCYFDGNKCAPCVEDATGTKCTRKNPWLDVDLKGLSVSDAFGRNPLQEICGYWSTLASGTTSDTPGELSLADCPAGGCLGFTFTLKTGFKGVSYAEAAPPNWAFDKDLWTANKLVGKPEDLLCGLPRQPQTADFIPMNTTDAGRVP